MWELIEVINGVGTILDLYSDFDQCQSMANIQNYLNDGMARVLCAVTV